MLLTAGIQWRQGEEVALGQGSSAGVLPPYAGDSLWAWSSRVASLERLTMGTHHQRGSEVITDQSAGTTLELEVWNA